MEPAVAKNSNGSDRKIIVWFLVLVALFVVVLLFVSSERLELGHFAPARGGVAAVSRSFSASIRILCLVMTNAEEHELSTVHVKRTWARRCSHVIYASNKQHAELETVVMAGKPNLTESLTYAYDYHGHRFDWLLTARANKNNVCVHLTPRPDLRKEQKNERAY